MNHSRPTIMPSYSGIDKKEKKESKGSRDATPMIGMVTISLQIRVSRIVFALGMAVNFRKNETPEGRYVPNLYISRIRFLVALVFA